MKWLIEQRQQKSMDNTQQNQELLIKQRTNSGLLRSSSLDSVVQSVLSTRGRGISAEIWREVLLMCTSESSSPEVEESCGRIVKAAPPVLTKVIKIEVMKEMDNHKERTVTGKNVAERQILSPKRNEE